MGYDILRRSSAQRRPVVHLSATDRHRVGVYQVCVEDYTIKETATIHQVDRVYLGKRFREAIDEAQKFFDISH